MIILTDENFDKEINRAEKLVLVDFFAEWCGPCKMIAPILEKLEKEFSDKIVLAKANVDEIPVTATKFKADRIPMVILFKAGRMVDSFIGLMPEDGIREWIKKNIGSESTENESEKINEMIKGYEEYASKNNLKLNPDRKVLERIMKGLLGNEAKHGEKYCPCRRVTGDKTEDAKKICPCIWHKDEVEKNGHCFCNLFVKP